VDWVLGDVADRGVTRVLVEGGAMVATAFLKAAAVDRLMLFRAPLLFGDGGHPAVTGLGIGDIGEAPAFDRLSVETIGEDILETYRARD
jgi:diaminohydroxyphosphoribosylaminopyrimidine deaminase/5-amino-6-(5-phosphoribosylamino)uracil reductase